MNLGVTEAEISELLRKAINLELRNSLRDSIMSIMQNKVSSTYIAKYNFLYVIHVK